MFSRAKLMLAVALGRMLGSAPLSLHKAAMDHNRTVDVLRAAEASRSIAQRLAEGAARLIPRRRAKGNGYKGLNGAQAMARRMRQMARGIYQCPTIWVDSNGLRWTTNSHGQHKAFYW
jgi:hypothetical protein